MRVLARDHPDVDDGWLCDKGRFAYQAIHVDERITVPLVRDGDELREVPGSARWRPPPGWPSTAAGSARSSAARPATRRASCSRRLMREGLDSADIDSRARARSRSRLARALASPALQAAVPDLEFAHTVLVLGCEPLDEAPILDLRIRKGVRRRGVQLAVATRAAQRARCERARRSCATPGRGGEFLSRGLRRRAGR